MYKLICYIFIFFASTHCVAQEFNYVHYDTKDGLACSTVYEMCQDKDGFLWFATENGLSRFDGTHFKNFTVKDGLTDNEVLSVFGDKKGRVWISTFNRELCYYYQGKIYNQHNDTLLKKLQFKSSVHDISEIQNGAIAFNDQSQIVIIGPDQQIRRITSMELIGTPSILMLISNNTHFLISCTSNHSTYSFDGMNSLRLYAKEYEEIQKVDDTTILIPAKYVNSRATEYIRLSGDIIRLQGQQYDTVNFLKYINSSNGIWEVDTATFTSSNHFLSGKKATCTIKDLEGNLWFCTNGEGVFKLSSKEIRTINPAPNMPVNNKEVFSVNIYNNKIMAGIGFSKVLVADRTKTIETLDYSDHMKFSGNFVRNNRLYTISNLSSGVTIFGFDAFLVKLDQGKTLFNYSFAIKSISEIDQDNILVGTSGNALKVRVKDMVVVDTIWKERCTKVLFYNNKYYLATLRGLFEVDINKKSRFLGAIHPSLSKRLVGIEVVNDGSFWIATSDKGLINYKDDQILHAINDSNGLSSNICRSLFLQGNQLWVGTNKGVNKIDLSQRDFPVIHYSTSDGLPSDLINGIFVQDSIVWVGSPAGLTFFNEKQISTTSMCRLKMLTVSSGGTAHQPDSNYSFSYKMKNLRFEYVAVSFKSGNEITYWYRLNGLNNGWQQTNQTNLDYQSLPSGNYDFYLYAVNKFGVKSNAIHIRFVIDRPFWKTWWFVGISVLLIMGMILFIVARRNKKIRVGLEEKNRIQQQFASLEQQALQAQMNPHFIFNCLNSIQQYILTNDKEKANEYLTGFASLVRQTLDSSSKKTVTIAEEARYLGQYMEMEKMRFGDNFTYEINIAPTVKSNFIEMPALLLQPYVENSLRHGIRYKQDHSGHLYCMVRDNGIGRKKAMDYKSMQHIEYQSKGISLTQKRISLLNKVNQTEMHVTITDLTDQSGNATGTEVTISIPI